MTKYTVGQELWIRDVNEPRVPASRGVVNRVGRSLVHVSDRYGTRAYRIADGMRNDIYEHQWLQTDAEKAEADLRISLIAALGAAGVRLDQPRAVDLDLLQRLVNALED